MSQGSRPDRVADQIRAELATLLEIDDERFARLDEAVRRAGRHS